MSGHPSDEAKEQKFQDRLARISRRRFVKAAMFGGVAAVAGFGLKGDAQQNGEKKEFTELTRRCANTKTLLGPETINNLFRVKNFRQVLSEQITNVDPGLRPRVQKIITDLGASTIKLGEMFEKPSSAYSTALVALTEADQDFVLPFLGFGKDDRDNATKFLRTHVSTEKNTFLHEFGGRLFGDLMGPATLLNSLNPWQQRLMQQAIALGILSPGVRAPFTGKNECAELVGGNWRCTGDGAEPEDWCEIGTGGQPTASTDLCSGL